MALALFAALGAFHLLLALLPFGPGTGPVYRAYLLGWPLVTLAGFGAAWSWGRWGRPERLPLLLLSQALAWGLSWSQRAWLTAPAYLWAAPLAALALAALALRFAATPALLAWARRWCLPSAALALLAGLRHFDNGVVLPAWSAAALALAGLGAAVVVEKELAEPFERRLGRALDLLFLLAMAVLILPAEFSRDPQHQNFVLSPINELLHGRTPLVDLSCQYEIGRAHV